MLHTRGTLLTVGTARQVPRVCNTDDRQTGAARQHWTGVEPLKHRLSSILSDLPYTTNGALQHISLTSALVCLETLNERYGTNNTCREDYLESGFDIHSKTKNIFNMYINYVEIKRIEYYILPMYPCPQ